MKLRTTLFLLLLTAGLAAFILLHERRQPPRDLAGYFLFDLEGDVLRDEAVALELSKDEIGGIDLKSSAGNIAFRRGDDGTWEMARGLKDRASRDAIQTLLDFVSKARILDTLDREEVSSGKVKDSALGIDDSNAVEITYRKPGGGRLYSLRAGRTAPLGKAMYVRFNDLDSREDIYIVSPDLREFLTQPPDQFRDRALTKYPAERIRRISVKRGEGEIELTRASTHEADGTPWLVSRPLPDAMCDQEVVAEFLSILTGAKILEFTPAAGASQPAGEKLAEVTLWPDGAYDRKGLTLTFYPDPDPAAKTAICRDRERKAEFKVDREMVDLISLADSPNAFRYRKLGNIEPAKVATVEVELTQGDSVALYRVGDRWAVSRKGTQEFQAASGDAVEKLIRNINDAEILEFANDSLTDKAKYGLEQPAIQLTFATGKHASLRNLSMPTTETSRILRLGILPNGKVFANFAGEPFVYQVGPEVAGMVPRQMIRWRTLQLPGFDRLSLRMLRQTVAGAPPVELTAAPQSFSWTATRAGQNVSELLQTSAAEAVAARLGSLQVRSWQGVSDASLQALAKAPIVIEAECDAEAGTPAPVQTYSIKLELAPMGEDPRAPLYYGRHSSVPGVFLIDSASVRDLTQPLLQDPAPSAPQPE